MHGSNSLVSSLRGRVTFDSSHTPRGGSLVTFEWLLLSFSTGSPTWSKNAQKLPASCASSFPWRRFCRAWILRFWLHTPSSPSLSRYLCKGRHATFLCKLAGRKNHLPRRNAKGRQFLRGLAQALLAVYVQCMYSRRLVRHATSLPNVN